jgi:hypothetical protein
MLARFDAAVAGASHELRRGRTGERGRWSRPAQDNRRYFNGMMWIMRTGAKVYPERSP